MNACPICSAPVHESRFGAPCYACVPPSVKAWSHPYPEHIGDLELGKDRSDGERMCYENHEVPIGHPLYWPQLTSQYDDSDPRCLEHAIERFADRNSDYSVQPSDNDAKIRA